MATITITIPPAQTARVAAAFGRVLNTRAAGEKARNATNAEVKEAIIEWLKAMVRTSEQAVQREAAIATVDDIDPT